MRILLAVLLLVTLAFGQRNQVTADWTEPANLSSILKVYPAYASVSDPVDTIATGSDSSYTVLSDWTAGNYKNTVIDTAGYIIFNRQGLYLIHYSLAFSFSVNRAVAHVSAFDNSTELTNIEAERRIGTGGDVGSMSAVGIHLFHAGDTLSIRGKASTSGNLVITHGNLSTFLLR